MSVVCPTCSHELRLRETRLGIFKPVCPKCGARFLLEITESGQRAEALAEFGTTPATVKNADINQLFPALKGISDRAAQVGEVQKTGVFYRGDDGRKDEAREVSASRHATPQRIQAPIPIAQQAVSASSIANNSAGENVPGSYNADEPSATLAFEPKVDSPSMTRNDSTAPSRTEASLVSTPIARQSPPVLSAVSTPARPASRGEDLTEAFSSEVTKPAPKAPRGEMPQRLGGYQVIRELGSGAMGSVYLARQLTLDRSVAVKTMRPDWAEMPSFVARFTREAYAAAQLVHHNVVQIYDIGNERNTNFFSMEFVEGTSLQDLMEKNGRIKPETALGYIVQAARGLQIAHDQGMVHRDVKPANLMLNKHGIIKVADLGLVKVPDAEESSRTNVRPSGKLLESASASATLAFCSMGTPAYMAPEQGEDAATVDARADVYSLGCTLYALIAGRPPFEGKTSMDVIEQHQNKPLVPLDSVVPGVAHELSQIVLRMTAKKKYERYASMVDVIDVLEPLVNGRTDEPFRPRDQHARLLDEALVGFRSASTAGAKRVTALGFLTLCAVILVGGFLFRSWLTIGVGVGLAVLTTLAYVVIVGQCERTHVWLKLRDYLLSSSWTDWGMFVVGTLATITALYAFNWLGVWSIVLLVAIGLAVGFYAAFDRKLAKTRAASVELVEDMLRGMRLRGLEEEALRKFVCENSGEHWEEFYEALFGFEAKLAARARWRKGLRGQDRPKFAAWREGILAWIDAQQEARRTAREKKLLQSVEAKSLQSQGMSAAEARKQAAEAARQLISQAAIVKRRSAKYQRGRSLDERLERSDGSWLDIIVGPRPRFLVGALLVATCCLWLHQNQLLTAEKLKSHATAAWTSAKESINTETITKQLSVDNLTKAAQDAAGAVSQAVDDAQRRIEQSLQEPEKPAETSIAATKPIGLPGIPQSVALLLGSFGAGAAGLLLVFSSFFRGGLIGLVMFPAALLATAGPNLGVPSLGLGAEWISIAGATVIGILGLIFARTRDD